MKVALTAEQAERFAVIALGHVTREFPNKLDHVLAGEADARTPRALHPVFFGSFDWHSCVHGYWMLARLLRRFPDLPSAPTIRALLAERLTPAAVEGECAYLRRPSARGFERPYGWAWLLKLAEELSRHEDRRPFEALRPLAAMMAERFRDFLPRATYPIRTGTHFNTAFAIHLSLDYAETVGDTPLAELLRDAAIRWYGGDTDCQAWEPGGDEFLSSALMEAECMRRVLPAPEHAIWLSRFLPRIALRQPETLFIPATVSDRSDGKIVHLDGLNLSRAWCWRGLASSLQGEAREAAEAAAAAHLAAALGHVAGDYMGEHWLASFAVLALES